MDFFFFFRTNRPLWSSGYLLEQNQLFGLSSFRKLLSLSHKIWKLLVSVEIVKSASYLLSFPFSRSPGYHWKVANGIKLIIRSHYFFTLCDCWCSEYKNQSHWSLSNETEPIIQFHLFIILSRKKNNLSYFQQN